MNYVSYAKKEFLKLGYQPIDECEDYVIKCIQESVINLLSELSNQGHSGGSIYGALALFKKMSSFNDIEDVKKEFLKLGYKPIEECEEDIDKWFQEGTLKLLNIFNSGYKDNIVIDYFCKLGKFDPISPIMCTEDEWNEVGDDIYQNNRCSALFKNSKNEEPHYLDAIVWKNQNGNTYTGSALNKSLEKIKSSQNVKIPFVPKTFYIDVIEKEVAPDDYDFYIKDEKQLNEVWKYYKHQETKSYLRFKKLQNINDKFCN